MPDLTAGGGASASGTPGVGDGLLNARRLVALGGILFVLFPIPVITLPVLAAVIQEDAPPEDRASVLSIAAPVDRIGMERALAVLAARLRRARVRRLRPLLGRPRARSRGGWGGIARHVALNDVSD